MDDFMIRFGLCNLVLCGAIGILLLAKKGFQKSLSSRMQYHLWFLLLVIITCKYELHGKFFGVQYRSG